MDDETRSGQTGLARYLPDRLRNMLTRTPTEPVVDEISPIHPDIEAGMKHVVEEKLIDSVRTGNTAGITVSIRELSRAWKQAQKASDSNFELTAEAQGQFNDRVKQIMAENLPLGLSKRFEMAAFSVGMGDESSITSEPKHVEEIFQLANKFEVPISYLPQTENEDESDNAVVMPINSLESAQEHLQQIIERNLPKGLLKKIEMLGFQVGQGLLKEKPDREKRIDKWVDIMKDYGWKIKVDEGQASDKTIDLEELEHLKAEAIKGNLVKGVKHISEMVSFKVKSGMSNPKETWATPENISLYVEAGKQYQVENEELNEENVLQKVEDAIVQNLPEGIGSIISSHLRVVQEGNVIVVKHKEETLEEFLQMAKQYNVPLSEAKTRDEIQGHYTKANLTAGVNARLVAIKDSLRKASYTAVGVYAREAEEFRKFVLEKGFSFEVDFSELDKYLEETATKVPQLADKT